MANDASALAGLRVGFGFEIARIAVEHELKLGGVMIADAPGLNAGGDGDILCQAILDALLTACGVPDMRTVFPESDNEIKGVESLVLLSQTATALARTHLESVLNLSLRILQPPGLDITDERKRIQSTLAAALELPLKRITIGFGESNEFSYAQAESTPGAMLVFAHALCQLRTEGPSRDKGGSLKSQRQKEMFISEEANGPAGDDASLPERAQKFERALKSKLPPLPKAPPPQAGASLIVYTDGASRGNPGPSASGWVVLDAEGRLVSEGGSDLGKRTNNEAEYLAVAEAARWIEDNVGRELNIEFRLDSELVVKQLRGEWKLKDPGLKQLALPVMNQLGYFLSVELKHVPREQNQRADALANRALGPKQ
jgi:2-C-methyl-D-erythritol 2,4-cyclodiphosphate synthase